MWSDDAFASVTAGLVEEGSRLHIAARLVVRVTVERSPVLLVVLVAGAESWRLRAGHLGEWRAREGAAEGSTPARRFKQGAGATKV